jgi:hypothetical protein
MPDYFHSALRGDQIHESKIKVLPFGSPFPVPEWEGQLLAIGLKLYFAVKQNNVLTWNQPVASNTPVLPANVVTLESGWENPPAPRSGQGVIYVNNDTKEVWYLAGSWIKLGTSTAAHKFLITPNRAIEDWQGNYFGLLNPLTTGQENCLLITKWELGKKYYFMVKTPDISALGGADNNNFYLELWRGFDKLTLSAHPHKTESLAFVDTVLLVNAEVTPFRLGMYLLRNNTKLYLNFVFDFEARIFEPQEFAQNSYGY